MRRAEFLVLFCGWSTLACGEPVDRADTGRACVSEVSGADVEVMVEMVATKGDYTYGCELDVGTEGELVVSTWLTGRAGMDHVAVSYLADCAIQDVDSGTWDVVLGGTVYETIEVPSELKQDCLERWDF